MCDISNCPATWWDTSSDVERQRVGKRCVDLLSVTVPLTSLSPQTVGNKTVLNSDTFQRPTHRRSHNHHCSYGNASLSYTVNITDTVQAKLHTKQRIAPVHGETNHFAHTVKLADGGKGNVNGEVVKAMCLRQATYRLKRCSV